MNRIFQRKALTMSLLEEARKKIGAADREIAKYFEIRMKAVEDVAKYKKEHSLPIFDKSRENALTERNKEYISDPQIRDLYTLFHNYTMEISRKYQSILMTGHKTAFSGIAGAYAHIAAKRIFPDGEAVAYPNFEKAYKAVENGECDSVVLPIENSTAGEVGDNIDMIYSGSLYITGIYELKITHSLLGKKGAKLSDIKEVVSHIQALEQCRDFITRNNLTSKNSINTAVAAKQVADSNDMSIGAIASKETAELYGLDIICEGINHNASNTTRFAVLSREKHVDSHNNLFTLGFTVKHEAGALAKAINIIGNKDFNMSMIKSRPLKDSLWRYYFFTEVEGNPDSESGKELLNELKECCSDLKVIGAYKDHVNIES